MVEFVRVASWEMLERRAIESIDRLVVHRIEVSQEDPSFSDRAEDVARFFREHPLGRAATGGAMPYPLLISRAGEIQQAVPLDRITPHARVANATGIGIGCIGDFRSVAPPPAQLDALVTLCADLCRTLGLEAAAVVGHDEISGGSHDPAKQCPGPGLAIDRLRERVAAAPPAVALSLAWTDLHVP